MAKELTACCSQTWRVLLGYQEPLRIQPRSSQSGSGWLWRRQCWCSPRWNASFRTAANRNVRPFRADWHVRSVLILHSRCWQGLTTERSSRDLGIFKGLHSSSVRAELVRTSPANKKGTPNHRFIMLQVTSAARYQLFMQVPGTDVICQTLMGQQRVRLKGSPHVCFGKHHLHLWLLTLRTNQ